jgi:hypothetical protein
MEADHEPADVDMQDAAGEQAQQQQQAQHVKQEEEEAAAEAQAEAVKMEQVRWASRCLCWQSCC